jgi:hypothetical protein
MFKVFQVLNISAARTSGQLAWPPSTPHYTYFGLCSPKNHKVVKEVLKLLAFKR